MEKQFKQLFQAAENNKEDMQKLSDFANKLGQTNLYNQIVKRQKQLFPETRQQKKAKKLAADISLLLRMVDLKVSDEAAYIIYNALKVFNNRGTKFNLTDAVKIKNDAKKMFT